MTWCPVASWGRTLDALEGECSRVLLELKALREGAWKLSEYTAYSKNLVMRVSPDLRALLKVANRAHPSVHAMLIDLSAYKPKFLIKETRVAPAALGMEDLQKTLDVEDMNQAEGALRKPMMLPPKARFSAGPHIHV